MAATALAISVEEDSEEDETNLGGEEEVAVSGMVHFSAFYPSHYSLFTEAAAAAVLDITEASMTILATAMVHQVVQEVCPGAVGTEVAVIAQTSSEKVQEVMMIGNINDPGISCERGIFLSFYPRHLTKRVVFPSSFGDVGLCKYGFSPFLSFFLDPLIMCVSISDALGLFIYLGRWTSE
jgi:hypothetical protein